MIDERGKRLIYSTWCCTKGKDDGQEPSQSCSELGLRAYWTPHTKLPNSLESSLATYSANLHPCQTLTSLRHMLGITDVLRRYMASNWCGLKQPGLFCSNWWHHSTQRLFPISTIYSLNFLKLWLYIPKNVLYPSSVGRVGIVWVLRLTIALRKQFAER